MKAFRAVALALITRSEQETLEAGERLGRVVRKGDVLALTGPLAAGKTVFVKGLAQGMGISRDAPVTSPTFIILHEYPGPLPLYHFDFYRIQSENEVVDLGFHEYLEGEGVVVVEWADRAASLFGPAAVWIHFAVLGREQRKLELRPGPDFPRQRLLEMEEAFSGLSRNHRTRR